MKGSRPLNNEEINLICQSFSGSTALRDRTLFIVGCKLGLRISELLSLTLKDVHHSKKIHDRIYIKRCNVKGKIEGMSKVVHQDAKDALLIYINNSTLNPEDFLFKSEKGGKISRIQAYRVLTNAYNKAGLVGKLGTHCMRKTFAQKVYLKLDRDLRKTQTALGHKSMNSTVSYLSFDQGEIDAAILS